jgi:hypothetical protein
MIIFSKIFFGIIAGMILLYAVMSLLSARSVMDQILAVLWINAAFTLCGVAK